MNTLLTIGVMSASFLAASDVALQAILEDGESSLEAGPYSVMDKKGVAPSGDMHDFLTLSPYYWPNKRTKDGLPYVMRDGQTNPEASSEQFDRVGYTEMGKHVVRLGLAYRASGDSRFAVHGAGLIRTWFLDPSTRMNPNLQYAQWRPGRETGSQYGIIRGITLLEIHDVTRWFGESDAWAESDEWAWREWLGAYVDWLSESKLGKKEARARNNHGTWYDLQVVVFSKFLGRNERARETLEASIENRIFAQIRSDGMQGKEIVRSKSWDYSVMNLRAFTQLARVGEQMGIELFERTSPDSGGIKGAVDYLIPFAIGETEWPHKQIREFDAASLVPVLLASYGLSGDEKYRRVVEKIDTEGVHRKRYMLEYGEVIHGK